MEVEGVINKSSSSHNTRAYLILKKNGDLRLVVDYRLINEATIKQTSPLPNIQDYLIQLQGSIIFSQIDLRNGYYQIWMKKKDKKKRLLI